MGTFSCPCVVCPGGGRVAGSKGLLKFSQPGRYWQAWKILGAVPEAEWYRGIFLPENNVWTAMATFDNSYRKCYNKCNDDNKKAICHQSPKFAL